ncbi:MAG: hypothetical protein NTY93_01285 [Candidatus Kaiserbacteria bacterium]|nr:hypothetical protein [Candidatus Kaiserbacteria bacterium]
MTFEIKPMVLVTIEEENKNIRKDGGLIHRFMHFLVDQDADVAYSVDDTPFGRWRGFLTVKDAKKAKVWLLKQGAKPRK